MHICFKLNFSEAVSTTPIPKPPFSCHPRRFTSPNLAPSLQELLQKNFFASEGWTNPPGSPPVQSRWTHSVKLIITWTMICLNYSRRILTSVWKSPKSRKFPRQRYLLSSLSTLLQTSIILSMSFDSTFCWCSVCRTFAFCATASGWDMSRTCTRTSCKNTKLLSLSHVIKSPGHKWSFKDRLTWFTSRNVNDDLIL